MCQSKAKGGKRCAIHMLGSRAVLRIAKALSGADDKTVATVFKDLRKEGAALPAPTPEMVQAFADRQRFSAQFNPDLNDHDRKIATRQWGAAAEDAPDGGTFHAWKHTIGETMRRSRSRLTAIAVSGALSFSLAACSGGALKNEEPTPAPTSISTTTPAPTTSPDSDGEFSSEFGIYSSDTQMTDQYGTYQQIEVSPDSALMQYDESTASSEAKAAYSAEDIRAAQQTVSEFYVSEGVDSTLVFDNSEAARTAWLDRNNDKIDPEYQDDAYIQLQESNVDQGLGIVEGNNGGWREQNGLKPLEYSTSRPRVSFESVKMTGVSIVNDNDLRFDYEATYVRPVYTSDGVLHLERTTATQSYSVNKGADGSWLLTGWMTRSTSDWNSTLTLKE